MKARDFIPQGISSYLRLILTRLRYPNREIDTFSVHPTVQLGTPCWIAAGVQIGRHVRIGDYSYVNDGTLIGSGTIGKFCSVGYYCEIGMHEHPVDYISTSSMLYGPRNIFAEECKWDEFSNPPVIGNDVWIASKAVILQGVCISDGAVIAAGSVVTKDVPPYAIVAGVPARIVRRRFNPHEIDALLALQWWNMSPSDLKQNKSLLCAGKNWYERLPAGFSIDKEQAA